MVENPIIMNVVDQILDLCNPYMIILFNTKYDLFDNLTSFKLCVIVPDNVDTTELEYTLYLELECENPFDVLLYKVSEWSNLCDDDASFAGKISKTGVVLYES
jgi:hypothetical protein